MKELKTEQMGTAAPKSTEEKPAVKQAPTKTRVKPKASGAPKTADTKPAIKPKASVASNQPITKPQIPSAPQTDAGSEASEDKQVESADLRRARKKLELRQGKQEPKRKTRRALGA
ncbi:hypothetical protein ABVK25_005285 [Lepraria finkii]|uniref:Uncharacterized protein n=1 Tax=Lepraria finkii TaxID=1340010 RepID=A0ABR4B9L1_9LECA